MVKPLAVFCAALFSCLAIAPASARAAVPGQNPYYTVRLLSVNGSGCPVGSAAVSVVTDTTFWVVYDDYIVAAGNNPSPPDFRKSCHLNVLVGVPAGWTYGIASEEYRGFAELGTGAQGMLRTSYYFGGIPGTYAANHSLFGPMSNDYEFHDAAPVVTFAPCHYSGSLNIISALRVLKGTDPSFFNELTLSTSELVPNSVFHLAFKQC